MPKAEDPFASQVEGVIPEEVKQIVSTHFPVKVKRVNVLTDLASSQFWKTQKFEKMKLIGNQTLEPNF